MTQIKTKRIEAVFVVAVALFVVPLVSIGGYFAVVGMLNNDSSIKDVVAAESEYSKEIEVASVVSNLGIKPKNNVSVTPISAAETTTIVGNKEKLLAVPYFKQIYTLSCEAASIQMVLSYNGITSNQDDLMSQIGYSTPIRSTVDSKGNMIWGDPDLGFVGDVDGYMIGRNRGIRGATGWGTKKGPVARVVEKYLPNSKAETGNIEKLRKELDSGNPVIFWHVRDDANQERAVYTTPAGKKVDLFQYHVAVIRGYRQLDEGVEFIVSDPLTGEYAIKQGDLNRIWQKHDYDMVVVRR